MSWPAPITLEGVHVRLAPLSHTHAPDLRDAARDGDLHKLWYTSVPAPDAIEAEIDRRLGLQQQGGMLPFAVIKPDTGQAVGMTTYMNVDAANKRVEIGSTWYRKAVQRTPLNTEAKLLLLHHAFDALDCIAVEFRTHFLNRQSRTAIERLGAKLDGILRSHQKMPNGSLRDTAVYSIIACEWPAVKAGLEYRLNPDSLHDAGK
ncbi:GNAT family N-acetyltransferase [Roseibium sp. RKSG952]|uniref:GNAT family N-acetyltransferase n=1 Tax=Roseibium sp. RKSG952 TaxID=2529384 RepID=UPI0012BD117D|nr:GNAT family protein [Roseibium sp. RKSG952]MTH97534.1 N-acetyltransferase [Roseibium sp. RKSG952]